MSTPCHLIAGSLGSGKTTAIRRFVAETAGETGVIVNDFGTSGYDADRIGEASPDARLRVQNIPGGCLCCTSAAQLLPAIDAMSRRPDVDRLIIEPSGVALLDPLLQMLREAAPDLGLELMPVVILFDPVKTRPVTLEVLPYWRHLAECADIAVINRCDCASVGVVDALAGVLEQWHPPKLRVVRTTFGRLDPTLFDLRGGMGFDAPAARTAHHTALPETGSFFSGDLFSNESLFALLNDISPVTERFKGVFRTDQGWMRMEIAGGTLASEPAGEAEQSRADWIAAPSGISDRLTGCRIR